MTFDLSTIGGIPPRIVRVEIRYYTTVGPLEGSDEKIITEGFLMAENLNKYFCSVFTGEDIVRYQYQRLSSKGERVRLYSTTNCNPKRGS